MSEIPLRCVVCFSVAMALVPAARITSGDSCASSTANARTRSTSPSAQRTSNRMLRPSVHPRSCNALRNCERLACERESFPWLMSAPTTRVRSAGCAGRADGHAATLPPMSAMKSRGPHCLPSGRRIVAGEAGRSEAPCGKQATSANGSNPALGARSWLVRPFPDIVAKVENCRVTNFSRTYQTRSNRQFV